MSYELFSGSVIQGASHIGLKRIQKLKISHHLFTHPHVSLNSYDFLFLCKSGVSCSFPCSERRPELSSSKSDTK